MNPMIKQPLPSSLEQHRHKEVIIEALNSAFDAVAGESAVEKSIEYRQGKIWISNQSYILHPQGKVYLLAVGKAAPAMARGALKKLRPIIDQGLIVTKQHQENLIPDIEILYGDHPIPGINSVNAALKIEQFLHPLRQNDTLICLISGGASALITYPRSPLSLEDLSQTTQLLLSCGATIQEINCLRKHLEIFKGGGLAKLANSAQVVSLIISDVIGDDISTIASGITAPDPTTFYDALTILNNYQLIPKIPSSVKEYIHHGVAGYKIETSKPDDPVFQNVFNHIIASNYLACRSLIQTFQKHGFSTMHLTSFLQGEAKEVGKIFASFARELAVRGSSFSRPLCWIAGGETTVTIKGEGIGGRNLELALGAVQDLAGLKNATILTLATDGEDGKSPVAGAVVNGNTLERAISFGMNPKEYLNKNDSYPFFSTLSDAISTYPTQTNVNDILLLIME